MVDPFLFSEPENNNSNDVLTGKSGELVSLIRREMYQSDRASVRFYRKFYNLQCQAETEDWMKNLGWKIEKSVEGDVVRYCVVKGN
jgi:hypothetical protein